jgi:hypothetical protein
MNRPEGDERAIVSDAMSRWSLHTAIKDFISDWGQLRYLVDGVLRDPALRS